MATQSHSSKSEPSQLHGTTLVPLPRVAIKFCVQCKWNLRAAYYAQELLSTFSLSLGEVALIPSTSGTFVVELFLAQQPQQLPGTGGLGSEKGGAAVAVPEHVLWDRKIDGGFPETKELKRRVRDLVEPGRGLGHVDRDYGRVGAEKAEGENREVGNSEGVEMEWKNAERGGEGGGDTNGTGTSNKLGDDAKYEKGGSTGNDQGDGEGEKCADCL